MFLHIGGDVIVHKKDVVAILDISTVQNQSTKEFLQMVESEGLINMVTEKGKEKSFVITTNKIYLSPISSVTLMKRSDLLKNEEFIK